MNSKVKVEGYQLRVSNASDKASGAGWTAR